MRLSLVPGFPEDHPESRVLRSPEGSKGIYVVTLVLGTPGTALFSDILELGLLALSGDSLLEIGNGIEIDLTLTSGDIVGLVTAASNRNEQLGSIRIRVQAECFNEALSFAYDFIAPTLSLWSYWYDVPLDIKGYEAIEETTGTRQYLVGVLGSAKRFDPTVSFFKFGEEFRSIFAIYREAMNATNFFYKVLSFYKVAEGVKALINERKKITLARNEPWREPVMRIPVSLEELNAEVESNNAFAPYLGKKFTSVLDHYRGLVRNAIAHLDPCGNALDADRFQDIAACEAAEPVLKYIARAMVNRELEARAVEVHRGESAVAGADADAASRT
jgi:hypothetical protein